VGALLGAALPVFELPAPEGEHGVGTILATARAGEGRELPVQIWYPAPRGGRGERRAYLPGAPVFLFHFRFASTNALEGAPAAGAGAPYPLVLYSHGYSGLTVQNSSLMEDLAARGVVAASVGHPGESFATVYPDGRVVGADTDLIRRVGADVEQSGVASRLAGERLAVWVADLRAGLDEMTRLAGEGRLAGKVDLGRVGAVGHSLGGAAAVQLSLEDDRVRVAAHVYGFPFGDVTGKGSRKPLLYLLSNEHAPLVDPIIARSEATVERHVFEGASALAFTDAHLWFAPWLAPRFLGVEDGARVHESMARYVLEFFERHF
jgi:dienelactone hydrolase